MKLNSNIQLLPMSGGSFYMRTIPARVTPVRKRTDIVATEADDLRRLGRARLLRFKSKAVRHEQD